MKKRVFAFGLLVLTFTSGLCIKQTYFDKSPRANAGFQSNSLRNKTSVCLKLEGTLYNRIQGTWINADSKDNRHSLSLTISKDTLTCWNGIRDEKYKLNISEDSLFGGVQIQNEQERLKYKPKVLLQQKIVKLTEDSLIFSHAYYYSKK